jgi:hypothetical protein
LFQWDANVGGQNPPKLTFLCFSTENGTSKPEAPKRSEVGEGDHVQDCPWMIIAMVWEIELDDGTCQRVIASEKVQSRNPTTATIERNHSIQKRSENG